jgi:WD40 repeat protein
VRPDQEEIWSCNVEHQRVHIHELTSGDYKEIASIDMPGRVYWVCFTPDSKYCLVSVRSEGKVAVVDCQKKEIIKLLEAGKEPKRTQVIDVPAAE